MTQSILLRVDSSRIDAAFAELSALLVPKSEFELDGHAYPKAADLLVDGALDGNKLIRIDSEPTTGRADEAFVALYPTEGFLELLAALRAFQADGKRVEVDGHGSCLL